MELSKAPIKRGDRVSVERFRRGSPPTWCDGVVEDVFLDQVVVRYDDTKEVRIVNRGRHGQSIRLI